MDLKEKLSEKQPEIIKDLHHKKVFFFLCMYKMSQISKGAYNWKLKLLTREDIFGRDLKLELDYDNWAQIFNKCNPNKQKHRYELTSNANFQLCRKVVRNDLVERKTKRCRKASEEFLKFKEKLRLDPYEITYDDQDVISALQVAFEGEIILTKYYVENKGLDAYLRKYKLGIEVDEYDH